MSINLYWDDVEQTVVLAEISGKWTWDDLHAMLRTVKHLAQERGRTLGAILDLRKDFQLPGGSVFNKEGLQNFRKILTLSNDDEKGPVVIVGMNGMIRMVFDAVSQFDKKLMNDVQFADTMAEAQKRIYSIVRQQGENIPSA